MFLTLALGVAYPSVRLTRFTLPFLVATHVEPDGEVRLKPGTYEIVEPESDDDAYALIITDADGQRLVVEPASWPTLDEPPPVFSVEETGVVSFDSNGQPVTLGQSNEFTGLLLVALVFLWGTALLAAVVGLVLLVFGLRRRSAAKR